MSFILYLCLILNVFSSSTVEYAQTVVLELQVLVILQDGMHIIQSAILVINKEIKGTIAQSAKGLIELLPSARWYSAPVVEKLCIVHVMLKQIYLPSINARGLNQIMNMCAQNART